MYRKLVCIISAMLILLIPTAVFADGEEEFSADADIEIEETESEQYEEEPSLPESDELLMQYLDSGLGKSVQSAPRGARKRLATKRNILPEREQYVYSLLKADITDIAAGSRTDTVLKFSAADMLGDAMTYEDGRWIITKETLGVDSILDYDDEGNASVNAEAKAALSELIIPDGSKIINTLLADCPYELYWYDKTGSVAYGLGKTKRYANADYFYYVEEPMLSFSFPVAGAYSLTGEEGTTETDPDKIGAANTCIEVVGDILADYADLSDLEKLQAYKDEICTLTDYNYDAEGNDEMAYGDPWQLIWVFDADPNTSVVCEGYSKAFKYLCDRTDFSDSRIACRLVHGTLTLSSGKSGNHMWNVVSMDDNKNYLADITNCDEGDSSNDRLFLKGCMEGGSVDGSYDFDTTGSGSADHTYIYSSEIRGVYSDDELALSEEDYDPAGATCPHEYGDWQTDIPATCTEPGTEKRVCALDPSHIETRDTQPLGHDYVYIEEKKATCKEAGVKAHYECSRCDLLFDEDKSETTSEALAIAKTDEHSWDKGTVTKEATCRNTGTKTYKCTVCGKTRTETIPVTEHKASDSYTVDKEPTCASEGTKSKHCTFCGVTIEGTSVTIPKTDNHSYGSWRTTETPTVEKEGTQERVCSVCGDTATKSIPKLDKTEGETTKPQQDTHETVKPVPSQPKEIMDLPVVKISKPKAAKKAVTVKWKKVSKKNKKKIQGIEIQYSYDCFNTIAGTRYAKKTKASLKIKGLVSKKKCWVRIRAYKYAPDGKHVSAWKNKSVKVK